MKSGIYLILCVSSMKSYIGSSVNIGSRFATHRKLLRDKKHWISYFQNSWNKYGESVFEFHVIEYCAKEKLIEREQFYLDLFQVVKHGFNLNPIAASTLGYKQTKETCKKISAAKKKQCNDPIFREKHKQMMASPEYKERLIKGLNSPESKALKSKKGKERYANPIERIKQSERIKATWRNSIERIKQSERIKATWQNPVIRKKRIIGLNKPEVITKNSERMKQLMSNPEVRKHLSGIATRQFADPEIRKKMSVLKKAQYSDPEFRLKQSMRNVKLSKEEARKIRILLALKVTPNSLTRMFKCGMATISNIKNNKILAYREVA